MPPALSSFATACISGEEKQQGSEALKAYAIEIEDFSTNRDVPEN